LIFTSLSNFLQPKVLPCEIVWDGGNLRIPYRQESSVVGSVRPRPVVYRSRRPQLTLEIVLLMGHMSVSVGAEKTARLRLY
ncbi:hypothetical protein PFISCL1PPCAC_7326, partial [Pristionchus fissidentatus]